MVLGGPLVCIKITGTWASATTRRIWGSKFIPEMSLTTRAPAKIAWRATSALVVSIEIPSIPAWAKIRITGNTRESSSSTGTGSDPGRVDSPPMSIRSAPAANMRKAASAASSGVWWAPAVRKGVGRNIQHPHDGRPMVKPRQDR
jgi:hypothetical protein